MPEVKPRGVWGRLVDRFAKSAVELEADELYDTTVQLGATPIDELVDRAQAVVFGEVRSVALRPRAQVAALVVELWDGTGTIDLVWLGRRAIAAIEPGLHLRARGRVTYRGRVATIFNPSYEIVP